MDTILETDSTIDFLNRVEVSKKKFFVVCDEENKYLGVVTEGDLRRYITKNKALPIKVSQFYNKNGFYEYHNEPNEMSPKLFDGTRGKVPIITRQRQFIGTKPHIGTESSTELRSVTCFAPVRISFAGGGSDLEYWWRSHRGRVVNLAINKYARIRVRRNFSDVVNINSINLDSKLSCPVTDLTTTTNAELSFITRCLAGIGIDEGFDIEIFCDFQPGSGLGGSSSLVVAIVKAFSIMYRLNLSDRRLIELAYQLERSYCGIEGGWQDFIPAVTGGLNVINFDADGFKHFNLSIDQYERDYFNHCLFLSPIGPTRSSSGIHNQQRKHASSDSYMEKMQNIVEIADECVDFIGSKSLSGLGSILHKGWLYKRSLGDFISTTEIDQRYKEMLRLGATGGRLLGAGGAGYLLLDVPVKNQPKFIAECEKMQFTLERVQMSNDGVRCIINES